MSKALMKSLVLHSCLALLLIALGSSLVQMKRPLVIDLTLGDSTEHVKVPTSPSVSHLRPMQQKMVPSGMARDVPEAGTPLPANERIPVEMTPSALTRDSGIAGEVRPLNSESRLPVVDQLPQGNAGMGYANEGHNHQGPQAITARGEAHEGSSNSPAYLKKNFLYIREMIQRYATYPAFARKMGWEGKVTISFIIASDGRVRDVKALKSSGRDLLDKSAMRAVREASPFPRPPFEAQLIVPVLFRLH